MMLVRSFVLFAAVLTAAVPASAAEVKVTCLGTTVITYQPAQGIGNVSLFNVAPEIVGVQCVGGGADQHLLKIGNADPVAFASPEKMKSFLGALGTFITEHSKKSASLR